jgi:hypothetical protein
MSHRFVLEKYSGSGSRYACPKCGNPKSFTKYVDVEPNAYISSEVGRCNRESKCGYHYPPSEYFKDNPQIKKPKNFVIARADKPAKIKIDIVSKEILYSTLCDYDKNQFVIFLLNVFGREKTERAIKTYWLGTWDKLKTIFWQIDSEISIRTGKIILYDSENGKRDKFQPPYWVHSAMKKKNMISQEFALKQCLFGEHLLNRESDKPIAIVESEKTAIIASLCIPDLIWMATGGCRNLNLDSLRKIKNRRTILFPDSSKFELWSKKMDEAKRLFNADLKISNLLETKLTEAQKREDYDIADFLLAKELKEKAKELNNGH